MNHRQQLIQWIKDDNMLMAQLQAIKTLKLESACIGAGAIRNLVWDKLHGFEERTPLADVDVVYLDAHDLTEAGENRILDQLLVQLPNVPWEVVNQSRVHLWYEDRFGISVSALTSLEEALATWPETATAVGAYLAGSEIEILAPLGLDDLFNLTIRHNPVRMNAAQFRERQLKKQFEVKWPLLQTVPAEYYERLETT